MNAEINFILTVTDFWSVLVFPHRQKCPVTVTLGQNCRHFSESCHVTVTEIDSGID